MFDKSERARIEAMASTRLTSSEVTELAADYVSSGSAQAVQPCVAQLIRVAFAAPWDIVEIFDAFERGYLGSAAGGPIDLSAAKRPPLKLDRTFWDAFWNVVDPAEPARDALDFTARVAALGQFLDPDFIFAAADTSILYPDVHSAAVSGEPDYFQISELSRSPVGSLANEFYRMITQNGFDLEVLDREQLGLRHLPYPLDFINAKMLQIHDVWHIVAGYQTTSLHEVGVSAFQLAQCGHSYSAKFLAVVVTSALRNSEGLKVLLDVVFTAWRHGRSSPPLISVDWREIWNRPLKEVRAELGLQPYESPYPADLVERIRAAS
jgi:ubiquinone biosynthesis protein Coq4